MRYVVTTLNVLLVLLVYCNRPAAASPVLFTFTGQHELAGQFILDDAASFTLGHQGETLLGTLSSPIQRISGTYGDYAFEGAIDLFVMDQPAFFSNGQDALLNDFWIGRSTVSGSEVNGREMTNLNLFVYTSPAALTDVSLIPPPIVVNPTLFQYTIRLSDGAIAAAPLNTLVRVAEPSTPWLLGLGLSGLVWLRRRLGGAS